MTLMRCLFLVVVLIGVSTAAAAIRGAPKLVEDASLAHYLRYNATSDSFTFANETALPVVVTVFLNESLMVTGWDTVVVEANFTATALSEERVYYAAGYAEAALTQHKMYQRMFNMGSSVATARADPQVQQWVRNHRQFMLAYATENNHTEYGQQLLNLLHQLKGLADGYQAVAPGTEPLSDDDIFAMNFLEEWGELLTAFMSTDELAAMQRFGNLEWTGAPRHCSALTRVLKDDVMVSHVTWTRFESMQRQYKTYRFGDKQVTMSSYPGTMHSIDDWYMTGNKLAVMETTNGVYNASLFRDFVATNYSTVSEFLRVMIANYIAADAKTWVETFIFANNGLYNNQFQVFDMKLFVPNSTEPLAPNTFWIVEQLPGPFSESADMTWFLQENGHWPSYNVPYFPSVYNISGNLAREQQYGAFFSYKGYARAQIFARNYSNAVDLATMQLLMRYNDFKFDPLSRIPNCAGAPGNVCSPPYSAMLAIASRGDLNPPDNESHYGPLQRFVGQRDHGATDAKIATWSNMMGAGERMVGIVTSGPTHDQQPVFQWSTSPWANDQRIRHVGLPDRFDFGWFDYAVSLPAAAPPTPEPRSDGVDEDARRTAIIIGCIGGALAAIATIAVLVRANRTKRREAQYLMEDRA